MPKFDLESENEASRLPHIETEISKQKILISGGGMVVNNRGGGAESGGGFNHTGMTLEANGATEPVSPETRRKSGLHAGKTFQGRSPPQFLLNTTRSMPEAVETDTSMNKGSSAKEFRQSNVDPLEI